MSSGTLERWARKLVFAGLLLATACEQEPPLDAGTEPSSEVSAPKPGGARSASEPSVAARVPDRDALAALPESALEQLHAIRDAKLALTPVQSKLSSQLWFEARRADPSSLAHRLGLRPSIDVDARGSTLVDVTAVVSPELLAKIQGLGGNVTASVPRFDAVQARLPLGKLEALAEDPAVRSIEPALGLMTNRIDVSEGDVAHRADVVRALAGVDGSGVRIGVLSDGVETLTDAIASGDLPEVNVLPGQAGTGDEGTAMLEIVHDLAPGAELMFATAHPSEAQFALNILALREAGCDVIVDDIFYFAEGSFQDDVVARAVDSVSADGALYFSSAGNSGSLVNGTSGAYEADYLATTPVPSSVLAESAGYDSVHDFGGGVLGNLVTRDSPSFFTLEWSDPLGQSANDYDLFLMSPDLSTVISTSVGAQNGSQNPLEGISSRDVNDLGAVLLVALWDGDPARHVRLSAHRGRLEVATGGQIGGHAAAETAFAIAAIDVAEAEGGAFTATNPVEGFSSDGPRRVFFDPLGNALTPGDVLATGGAVRPKPDFAAADGVSTRTPGFNPFYGTSAAAPHAAALAVLLLEARPDIRAASGTDVRDAVRDEFVRQALDVEAAGFDALSGFGTMMADAVLGPCAGVVCEPLDGCHDAGVCDSSTGECSHPLRDDGSSCDDGDACTLTDSCTAGVCSGADPIQCFALDQCHEPGTCDPETGICSQPPKLDGMFCDDADECTQFDSCQLGACVGTDPVVCTASDLCHAAGTCDPTSGTCSDPSSGAPDSDGDGSCDLLDANDDGDALADADEIALGTNPVLPDVNSDGGIVVGSAGITLTTPDGLVLMIAPNSIAPAPSVLHIALGSAADPDGVVSSTWELEPSGGVGFAPPALLTLPFDVALAAGEEVAIAWWDDTVTPAEWVPLEACTVNGDRVTCELSHFTDFAVVTLAGGTSGGTGGVAGSGGTPAGSAGESNAGASGNAGESSLGGNGGVSGGNAGSGGNGVNAGGTTSGTGGTTSGTGGANGVAGSGLGGSGNGSATGGSNGTGGSASLPDPTHTGGSAGEAARGGGPSEGSGGFADGAGGSETEPPLDASGGAGTGGTATNTGGTAATGGATATGGVMSTDDDGASGEASEPPAFPPSAEPDEAPGNDAPGAESDDDEEPEAPTLLEPMGSAGSAGSDDAALENAADAGDGTDLGTDECGCRVPGRNGDERSTAAWWSLLVLGWFGRRRRGAERIPRR